MAILSSWTRRVARNWHAWIALVLPAPQAILEIGVFEGYTSRWFLDSVLAGAGHWIGIDPWEIEAFLTDYTRDAEGRRRVAAIEATARENLADYGERATIIKGRSCDVLRLRPHPLLQPEMLDLVYMDGVHHAMEVLSDAMLVWPLVHVGGVIVFDDYEAHAIVKATGAVDDKAVGINAFLSAASGKYDLLFTGKQLGIQKTSDITFEHPDDVQIHPKAGILLA